jgi:hypothetical protein
VGVLYLGTEGGGVYTSSNNGGFWTPWALNTGSPEVVLAITKGATTVNGETWWVATTSGLYRRIGTGAWEVRTGGNGYVVNDVAVDPNCPTRVYAAFGFVVGRIQHRGGIRVSTDNGTTWSSITAGNAIHNTPVTDVEVDALSPRYLYAASYGRGLWVYDWGTPPSCQ